MAVVVEVAAEVGKGGDYMDKKVALNINVEATPILYTDSVFMSTNEDGLILEVGQKITGTNQLRIVSRIGMSRTHAKKFVKELGKLLAMTEGKTQTNESN